MAVFLGHLTIYSTQGRPNVACTPLQATAMDNLVVHRQLFAPVIDYENSDASPPTGENIVEPRPEASLVNNRKPLLDISCLCHGNHPAVIAYVKNAVLLEHWAEHVLDHDARARMGDEAGLFVELLREQVDAQVAVLACVSRGSDANHLTWTALEHDQVAHADMVAGNGDGVAVPRRGGASPLGVMVTVMMFMVAVRVLG